MIKLEKGAWVLVADGRKALFLRNDLDDRNYDLNVIRQEALFNPASRLQGTDRPGRPHSAPGGRRAGLAETDWHQLAEDKFAEEIAAILNGARKDGAFSSLVIFAPPAVLGELRPKLSAATIDAVLAEIPKTLTNHPIDKIESLLMSTLDAM